METAVPMLMIWDERDLATVIGCAEGAERYFSDLNEHRFRDTSHWIGYGKSELVNRLYRGLTNRSQTSRAGRKR